MRRDLPHRQVPFLVSSSTALVSDQQSGEGASASSTTCVVQNNRTVRVNQRTGPGLGFAAFDVLDLDGEVSLVGYTTTAGWTWYKTDEDLWVREDVVTEPVCVLAEVEFLPEVGQSTTQASAQVPQSQTVSIEDVITECPQFGFRDTYLIDEGTACKLKLHDPVDVWIPAGWTAVYWDGFATLTAGPGQHIYTAEATFTPVVRTQPSEPDGSCEPTRQGFSPNGDGVATPGSRDSFSYGVLVFQGIRRRFLLEPGDYPYLPASTGHLDVYPPGCEDAARAAYAADPHDDPPWDDFWELMNYEPAPGEDDPGVVVRAGGLVCPVFGGEQTTLVDEGTACQYDGAFITDNVPNGWNADQYWDGQNVQSASSGEEISTSTATFRPA